MRPRAPSRSKHARTGRAPLNSGFLGADCNSFRLSIEWSRLYPRQGELNKAAVERYNAIFDTLERCGSLQQSYLHFSQGLSIRCKRYMQQTAVLVPARLDVARYSIRARKSWCRLRVFWSRCL